MKTKAFYLVAITVCMSGWLVAQSAVQVQRAELSIPFGTARGVLVSVSNYLIFVDEDRPEMSFAIERSAIKNIAAEKEVLTVDTHRPVQDRSGQKTRLVFRLKGDDDAATVARWAGTISPAPVATAVPVATGGSASVAALGSGLTRTYQARHKHRFGGCSGSLILTENGVAYDSIDKIEDSRQWQPKDIKEIKLKNPYQLQINPFVGEDYELELLGTGIDSQVFKQLVDRITAARVVG